METEGNFTMELASLGRPFQLGMLYDCRSDSIIPGVTLWDSEMLNANWDVNAQPKTQLSIITTDTIEDKSFALNMTGDLKSSFLAGMIQMQGSAKYLNDTKKSQHQARVTLQYSTTTRFVQLNTSRLWGQNMCHSHVFHQGMATHVVTALLYGAQAFFVFDREVSSSESSTDIQSHMVATINNISRIPANEGKVSLKMTEEEKANSQQFSCTFYGDYSLPSNPTSFIEAIDIYSSLPQRLGKNGEHGVPMKVWLFPLIKLDANAARLVRSISVNLISRSQAILENLNEVDMRCSDMIKEFGKIPFLEIKQKLQRFKMSCLEHRGVFQRSLASVLPAIRGGRKDEGILEDILNNEEHSPLRSESLNKWLDNKKKEMSVVKSYLTAMKDIKLVTEAELDMEILDPMTHYVVSFMFTSLHEEDLYLSAVDNYLQSQNSETANLPTASNPGQEQWFHSTSVIWECARSFMDFHKANRGDGNTKFIVASVPDKDHAGASIYLFERGKLVSRCFKPSAKPLSPSVCRRAALQSQPVVSRAGQTVGFKEEYSMPKQESLGTLTTQDRSGSCTTPGFSPDIEYGLGRRTTIKCDSPMSNSGRVSQTAFPVSAPGKPTLVRIKGFDLDVTWEKPAVMQYGVTIDHYKLQYHERRNSLSAECDQWQEIRTNGSECRGRLRGLKPSTCYIARVYAVCGHAGESAPSQEASMSTESLARNCLTESNLWSKGFPSIYQLQVQEVICECNGDPVKYMIGKQSLTHSIKSIMVFGATGSGKTTLINAMVNYIFGVGWEDDFRFQLIFEKTNRSQSESQTSSITAYQLNHQEGFRIPYSLIIIDTPGFGDTRGIAQDKLIADQIRDFFKSTSGVDQIDAVCFVVQASLPRLTPTQKYTFDSILSIFGKDIAENISVLITFADANDPAVLDAINQSGIPCPKDKIGRPIHFKFNNSVIFKQTVKSGECDSDAEEFDKMYWKMGSNNMKKFFAAVSTMPSKSLSLTKEVLLERQQLDITVQGLHPQIRVGLRKLHEIRKTRKVLLQNKAKVQENENFEYEVEVSTLETKDISEFGKYAMNCRICKFTCDCPCTCLTIFKRFCTAMDLRGNCKVCAGKCANGDHQLQNYVYQRVTKTEKRTYQDLKERYEKASNDEMNLEDILLKLEEEFKEIQGNIMHLVERLACCLARLKEIALKPNPLSILDYIDLLIETEKQQGKPEFQERIQLLTDIKEQALIIAHVASGKDKSAEEATTNPKSILIEDISRREDVQSHWDTESEA